MHVCCTNDGIRSVWKTSTIFHGENTGVCTQALEFLATGEGTDSIRQYAVSDEHSKPELQGKATLCMIVALKVLSQNENIPQNTLNSRRAILHHDVDGIGPHEIEALKTRA